MSKTNKSSTELFYERFFRFASVWNIGAGLMGILSLKLNLDLFYGKSDYMADDLFKIHYYNFWAFIMMMGVGFYFVSRDVSKNYAMAIVGILGKTLAVAIWVYYWWLGEATFMVLVAGAGDMTLVAVFTAYLRYTKKEIKLNN